MGTFLASAATVIPLAALAYPVSVVLPKNESDAWGVARLSFNVSIGLAILLALALYCVGDSIFRVINADKLETFWPLFVLALLFSGWMQTAQQWLVRQKAFRETARAAILHALFVNASVSAIGLFYPSSGALITIYVIGIGAHALMLGFGALPQGIPPEIVRNKKSRYSLYDLAYKYRDFPLYRAPQNVINAASQNVPVLFLFTLVGPSAAGFYALSKRIMGAPSSLLAESVGRVFYPYFAEVNKRKQSASPLLLKATCGLGVVGLMPFAVVFFWGPWIFATLFGVEWSDAGEYARWLSLMYYFNFINRPSVMAVPVLGLQRGLLIYEIFSTGGKVAALGVGLMVYSNEIMAVALFSISGAVAYVCLIFWVIVTSYKCDWEKNSVRKTS